ncbi:helix-turn-helix transcriptional regulator [Variovorax guangxiensis]|uniref:AlpA family phage regulatory protein n=1 Tax=Variovorax guangxiensis TaxID=1775474 RepID=A0A502DNL7_9BURK|nr:hypothetical protein [Variovorax guangxiensis]TPG20737.1 hypothetical protein EAH83_18485 [Variovorax ginsengisoli]TPG25676.1 hypothetical protein EAH82_14650 [Variovorax guangxiensis]
MSNMNQTAILAGQNYQLIRKKRLLEKVPFSKSTLHAKMAKGRYQDTTFPLPIYFPGSRIPYWREAAIDSWIALAESRSRHGSEALGELGHTTAPLSSSLTAPQTQPENRSVQTEPLIRDGVLSATGLDSRRKRISLVMRRKRAAMPIAAAPVPQPLPDMRNDEVAASQASEYWTYTSCMEKSAPEQAKPSLTILHEVTPVYGECAADAFAQQFAPQHPPAPRMFCTGLI